MRGSVRKHGSVKEHLPFKAEALVFSTMKKRWICLSIIYRYGEKSITFEFTFEDLLGHNSSSLWEILKKQTQDTGFRTNAECWRCTGQDNAEASTSGTCWSILGLTSILLPQLYSWRLKHTRPLLTSLLVQTSHSM